MLDILIDISVALEGHKLGCKDGNLQLYYFCNDIHLQFGDGECHFDIETEHFAVGGEFIGIDSTMVLAAGAQYTAAWMIPVLVSAIGIGIVIARKF